MERILELKNKYEEAMLKKRYATLIYKNDRGFETNTEVDRREPIIFNEDENCITVCLVNNPYNVKCEDIIDIH